MESSFDVMLFAFDQFVTYSVITINNEENIIVSIASRIFYTPSGAGTELCVDYILSLSLSLFIYIYIYIYICVCVFVCIFSAVKAYY
jgi:hypothetical protein